MGGRKLVAVTALAGLLAACTGSAAEPDASPTIPVATPSPTPTPMSTPEDPYAVPEEIDEEYLNRVFEALERVIGDATRLIVAQKTYPPEADELYQEVYGPDALQVVVDGWIETLIIDPDLDGYVDPPGNRATSVTRILDASTECVYVEVMRDFAGVRSVDVPNETIYVVVLPDATEGSNPTPWRIHWQARLSDDAELPEDSQCEIHL